MIITRTWPIVDYGQSKYPRYQYPPSYLDRLDHYPKNNPVFIAIDTASFNYIQRLKGICLFCNKSSDCYDLSFFYQREAWVLYSQKEYFSQAMHLARAIQVAGALQISVILIDAKPPRSTYGS